MNDVGISTYGALGVAVGFVMVCTEGAAVVSTPLVYSSRAASPPRLASRLRVSCLSLGLPLWVPQ